MTLAEAADTLIDAPEDPRAEPEAASRVSTGRFLDLSPLGGDPTDRDEFVSYRAKLRAGAIIGFFVYLMFGVSDYMVAQISGASFAKVISLRLLFQALIGVPIGAILWLPLTHRQLRFCDAAAYGIAALGVSVMCIPTGGIASDYYAGVMLVHVCRNAFMSDHWKQTLLPSSLIVFSYPAVLLSAALVFPHLSAALSTRVGLFQFLVQNLFILVNAILVGFAGHAVWGLRRKVYESRALGRYRLERQIGTGGMGEVWSATHPRLRRRVAVKILRRSSEDEESIQRFEREVAATSQLTHPNTVRVFDYGVTDDGILYYVMELLDGETLAQVVQRSGRLPAARALFMIDQAARALGEAHQFGICHRDVKPENLFVTRTVDDGDFVKLLDFGVAKLVQSGGDRSVTRTGAVIGTPDYISPEVALGRGADARTDVYGLGAVLFFCLTGRPPFEGDSLGSLIASHISVTPPRPSEVLGAFVDPGLEAVIMRALAKEPEDRFQDAGALALALETCADFGKWRPAAAGSAGLSEYRLTPTSDGGFGETVTDTRTTSIERGGPGGVLERVQQHPLSSRGAELDRQKPPESARRESAKRR